MTTIEERETKDLINEMKRMNKGAKAHTINKATMYLEIALRKGKRSSLLEPCRKGVVTRDWKEAEEIMKYWW